MLLEDMGEPGGQIGLGRERESARETVAICALLKSIHLLIGIQFLSHEMYPFQKCSFCNALTFLHILIINSNNRQSMN